MLAGSTHVKIGSYEYHLAEDQQGHYIHSFEPDLPNEGPYIEGDPGNKITPQPGRLLWAWTDWVGGEGARIFDPQEPDAYSWSTSGNSRIPGQFTGRPVRTYNGTDLTANYLGRRPGLAIADNCLWYGGGYRIGYWTPSTDVWQVVNSSATPAADYTGLQSLSTSYYITSMCGTGSYLYYAGWHAGSSGSTVVLRRDASNSAIADTVWSETTSRPPVVGMAEANGNIYAWTGRKLYELNVAESMPLAAKHRRKVFDSGTEVASTKIYANTWWADAVSAENSVFFFYATNGISDVYMYRSGPRHVWRAPQGFTIKSISYQNGVVFVNGHFSAGTSTKDGWGAIYAIPTDTLQPMFVTWVRRHTGDNLQMQEAAPAWGNQLIFTAAVTGRIFVYDMDADGLTLMDHIHATNGPLPTDATAFGSNDRIGSVATFGRYRWAVYYDTSSVTSGTYKLLRYEDDEEDQRGAGTATNDLTNIVYSPKWHMGYPMSLKRLHGFHLTYKPENKSNASGLKTGQEIKVEYKLDNDTSWTTAATITSATTPSSGVKGHHFISISSADKFFFIEVRISVVGKYTGGAGYQTPIVYGLTTEASLASYTETWTLLVRVKDEQGDPRQKNRKWHSWTLRDNLEDLATNKSAVTFLDGYRYRSPGDYTTHTVVVDSAVDVIERNAEGFMQVKLKSTNNG